MTKAISNDSLLFFGVPAYWGVVAEQAALSVTSWYSFSFPSLHFIAFS